MDLIPSVSDSEIRDRVTRVILDVIDTHLRSVTNLDPPLTSALEHLRLFLSGGKRIRAIFCYRAWEAAGGVGGDGAVARLAASLELSHAFALIQDDVIDRSSTRRGLATVHRYLADQHIGNGWCGDAGHFGSSVAFMLANLCWGWSGALIGRATSDPARVSAIKAVNEQMLLDGTHGECLELVHQVRRSLDAEQCRRVSHFKTGLIMFKPSLLMGAILVGASPDLLAAFADFGVAIGDAYQLRDDLLGSFGDPSVTGKPNIDDMREGKPTVLAAEALRRAGLGQAIRIRTLYGNPDLTQAQADELRGIFRDTGAVDLVEAEIADYHSCGLAALQKAGLGAAAVRGLNAAADTALRRSS